MKPTVGRIVHYIDSENGGKHEAAIISDVLEDGTVTLHVFNPDLYFSKGLPVFGKTNVQLDESATTDGTWHYPERD